MMHLSHLETNVTLACQNSCVACNHMVVPYRGVKGGPPLTTADQVARDLGALASFVHTDAWAAIGGEPTLHRDLVSIFDAARETRIADTIELYTHGQTLLTAEKMHGAQFWTSFDRLVVTVYPGKYTAESIAWTDRQCRDYGRQLVLKNEDTHPNFTTLLDALPSDASYTHEKYRKCWFRTMSRTVDFGYVFMCCTSPHIPQLLQGRPFGADGIAVDGLTEEMLAAYLFQDGPLGACVLCSGRDTPTSVAVAWHEERQIDRWLKASAGGIETGASL